MDRNGKLDILLDDGKVALCEEGVDRNLLLCRIPALRLKVALCEEGVDRNPVWGMLLWRLRGVALCEEGVDRNTM